MGSVAQQDREWQGPLLTVKQAALRLGLTEWQVRHSIEQGRIPAVRVSEHRVRVRAADVEALVSRRGEDAPPLRLAEVRAIREELEGIALRVRGLTERVRRLVDDIDGEGA